jgi:serine/threonine protein kinase
MPKRPKHKSTPETTKRKKLKSNTQTDSLGKTLSNTIPSVVEKKYDSFEADLNKLEEKQLLFRGSIACVYVADQIASKQYIDNESIANNEIAILSKCSNNNIVQLLGSKKEKMSTSITTTIYLPYYPQGSLLSLIRKFDRAYTRKTRKIQQKNRLLIMDSLYLQMKNAITHLKNLDICHVDIRPANILVNNNHFVLCDFGNSKEYGTYKLGEGYCLGFPYIVPPFGIANDNENTITFTESYDIWSLAMVMWSLYFGIGNSDGEFMSKRNLYSYDHQASEIEYWYHLSFVLRKVSQMINHIKDLNSKSNLTNKEKYKKYILERFVIMLDPDQTCTIEKLP